MHLGGHKPEDGIGVEKDEGSTKSSELLWSPGQETESLTRLCSTMNRPWGWTLTLRMPAMWSWASHWPTSPPPRPIPPARPSLSLLISDREPMSPTAVRIKWGDYVEHIAQAGEEISNLCICPIASLFFQTSVDLMKVLQTSHKLPGQAEGGLYLVEEISASGPGGVPEQHYETSTVYPVPK